MRRTVCPKKTKLSGSCVFGEIRVSLIKDRIICGISDAELKSGLLREDDLTFEKCVNIFKANELAEDQVKVLAKEAKGAKVHALKSTNQNYKKNKS